MKAKPNVSAEQLARLRAEDEPFRPMLESEMPAVREEWRQSVRSLTGVVSRHSKEIDESIQNHWPMTRPEVIERADEATLGSLRLTRSCSKTVATSARTWASQRETRTKPAMLVATNCGDHRIRQHAA